jgi:hypothetical protein
MPFDAFISYSNSDKLTADAVCGILEAAGIRCWIAPRDIRPGGEYGAAIIEAIDHCRVMVLIFSSNANDSRQIHREIERAVSKGVPIIPVRIENVAPTKSLEYFLGAIHWLDALSPPLEKHFQQLAETVKAILNVEIPARRPEAEPGHAGSGMIGSTADAAKRDSRHAAGAGRAAWLSVAVAGAVFALLIAGGVWVYRSFEHVPATASGSSSPPAAQRVTEPLVPELVPFISNREQAAIRAAYLPAEDHKALAINTRLSRFVTGQKDDETAKAAALDSCQKATGEAADPGSRCQVYALGNTVVSLTGRPPMPPQPWVVREPSIERPFDSKDVPLISEEARRRLGKDYPTAGTSKSLARSPLSTGIWLTNQSSPEEAIRRALEYCGAGNGVACMIIAVDQMIVVPIPVMMKVVGFFRPSTAAMIAPDARDDVVRRLANAGNAWNAVAVGANGRAGLALRAANEKSAIEDALAECTRQDHSCRVIGLGPFAVEPSSPP